VYFNLSATQFWTGQLAAALDSTRRCEEVAEATGDRRLVSLACYIRTFVLGARGDAAAAVDCAQRALEHSPNAVTTSTALLSLGYARWRRREPEAATEALGQALASLQRAPVRRTLGLVFVYLAEAHLLRADVGKAADAVAQAAEIARADGDRLGLGLAERTSARIALASGDMAGAERGLAQALDAFTSCDAEFEAAMTRLDLARVLTARAAGVEACAQIDRAIRVFDTAGAPARASEARDLARGFSARR
jgi:tetratricopeptide (TPR) repeat protein